MEWLQEKGRAGNPAETARAMIEIGRVRTVPGAKHVAAGQPFMRLHERFVAIRQQPAGGRGEAPVAREAGKAWRIAADELDVL
jgi:hypothetical protein